MATQLDCSPCYDGEPDYDPNDGTPNLTTTGVSRSRIGGGIGGAVMNLTCDTTVYSVDTSQLTADQTYIKVVGLFARSKLALGGFSDFQGQLCNQLSIQIVSVAPTGIVEQYDMVVFFEGAEVERYTTTLQPDNCGEVIGGMMPITIGDGGAIDDLRTQVNASSNYISMPVRGVDVNDQGVDPTCLEDEGPTFLEGATGPTAANVPAVRTGPERSLLFTNSKEIDNEGNLGWPSSDNMVQWNFDTEYWVPYGPNADCRVEGTTC